MFTPDADGDIFHYHSGNVKSRCWRLLKDAVLKLWGGGKDCRAFLTHDSFGFSYPAEADSIVEDDTKEGIVDVDFSVVLDEAQFSKFVHEEIDAGPRCADHLRQHLLRHLGEHLLRMVPCAVAREQEQSACQPFFAGVEELVDQILLNPNVSREHIGDEAVGELMFRVEHANHLAFLNAQHSGGSDGGRSRHADGLAGKAPFPKKIARPKDCDNGFFANVVNDDEFYATFLDV